jgi:hypothetical protein
VFAHIDVTDLYERAAFVTAQLLELRSMHSWSSALASATLSVFVALGQRSASAFAHAEHGRDGVLDQQRIDKCTEGGEPHPIGELVADGGAYRDG